MTATRTDDAAAAADRTFVVVATMNPDIDLDELASLRAAEHEQLERLQAAGRIGTHHLAPTRGTVFLEVFATDEEQVADLLTSLPFARFFEPDVFPIAAPPEGP